MSKLAPTILLISISLIIALPLSGNADSNKHDTDPTTGIEFVFIKGGTFVMGDILRKDKSASPPHRVTVSDFWMGKYEVTFDEYDVFSAATDREKVNDEGWGRGKRPVINISWHDAEAFAKWLSRKSGRKIRLPSESEWEYAARAGSQSAFWWGPRLEKGVANCRGCGGQWNGQRTAPVGSFTPNPYGLHDTAGNVYEWCLDTQHENYEGAPSDGSSWLRGNLREHITRGGTWSMPGRYITSYARGWDMQNERNNTIGMRLVMEP